MSFEKVEKKESVDSEKTPKSVFTYEVGMIVSVFAEDEEKARASLNENGGFVSHRTVELKDAVEIYKPENKD
jgi:phosphoribosylaminoimidazole (AIR) synthetase